MDKERLRNTLVAKLTALPNETIQSLSFALTTQLIKLLNLYPELQSQIGAGYLPLQSEIAPVYQELFRKVPLSLAYPVLIEGEMRFAISQGIPRGVIWLEGPYHVVEPRWLLIPGLGFDLAGARLGRGKAYYDRYLEDKDVVKIGLAWSGQLIDKIPVESHDFHMDFIITEDFCWDVNRQKRF